MLRAFWPDRLGGDNADFVYLQASIDGRSVYRIAGKRNRAFFNFTSRAPVPMDTY